MIKLKVLFFFENKILDAKCLEVLQLCSSSGRTARAIAGHIKQPRGPNVARGPRVGQPWSKRIKIKSSYYSPQTKYTNPPFLLIHY